MYFLLYFQISIKLKLKLKLKPGIQTKRGRIYGIVWGEQVEKPPWIMTTVRERE